MSGRRLQAGGTAIDRGQAIAFEFDGVRYNGFAGDTLASALLAAGVRIVGRSFKYHRPRGVWGHWVEEPNAIVDLSGAGVQEPNARATTTFLREGVELVARSVNAAPNAARDRHAWLDYFARFIPAGFYYKTFMWPSWHLYEPRIRAMSGLGRVDPTWRPRQLAIQRNLTCDVLIIGAGPAGLAAARAAVEAGIDAVLLDDRPEAGGSLLYRNARIDDSAAPDWIEASVSMLQRAGGRILLRTTAYGIYDHNLVCAVERHDDGRPDSLWRIRPRLIVLAAGAIERPLLFVNNDRPGVMSAEAGLVYLRRFGVIAGKKIVIAVNNDMGYEAAEALKDAGASVTILDSRGESEVM
ncbi:MAG: 2Fe-2S iron-sulfur cluster-binding protein, partial [Dongiaceae bacterium]